MAHEAIYDTVERLLDGSAGRVLDVPAGEGALAKRLIESGLDVQCGDLYPEMFKLDPTIVRGMNLDGRIPFEDGSFDIVICVEGLEHIRDPANAVGEFARLLRPGGRLIVSVPNIMNIEERLKWLLYGSTSHFKPLSREFVEETLASGEWKDEAVLHINPIGYCELRYLVEKNGLRVSSINIDKPKRKMWIYSPLTWMVRLIGRTMKPERRRRMWIDDLNSDAVLTGGNTLIIEARKV